jgi:hypothetical protein
MGEEMLRVLALHDLGHETLTKKTTEGGEEEKFTKKSVQPADIGSGSLVL